MAERGVDDDLVVVLIFGFPVVTQHNLRLRFLAQVCCPPGMGVYVYVCVCVHAHVYVFVCAAYMCMCMCACVYV